jgi:hypothetical protein
MEAKQRYLSALPDVDAPSAASSSTAMKPRSVSGVT